MYWNKKRKHKYNAKKVTIDGIEFDSKREGRMYSMLKKFNIDHQLQVKFEVQPKFRDAEDSGRRGDGQQSQGHDDERAGQYCGSHERQNTE